MGVRFEIVNDFDRFLQMRQSWNELVASSEVDHAFMKHEWFECWIRNLGNLDNLMIPAAWLDGQLMAVAPMQIARERIKGFPVKVLCFLSSGISPRCNFIVHESFKEEDFFDYIFGLKGWDLIITRDIDSDLDITKAYIEYLNSHKMKYKIEPGRMSPFLKTESSWDEYWRALSKSFRTNLNTGMNRLKKDNRTFNAYKVDDYETFDRILDRLVETSARSWKGEVGSDLRSTPELLSFYIDFSRKVSDMGLFELWVLEIDGRIAAFDYHLKGENALSLIRTDFDLEYKFYSPGNAIKLFLLKDLFNRPEVWEYDLGGQAVDYKAKWAHGVKEHHLITAGSSGIYGGLLMMGKLKVLPLMQRLFAKHEKQKKE